MEIAVSVCRHELFALTKRKAHLGFFAGLELLALIAPICADRDPLDVMLGGHRMGNFTYCDDCRIVLDLNDRNVLFNGCVGSTRDDLGLYFAAAGDRRSARFDDGVFFVNAFRTGD